MCVPFPGVIGFTGCCVLSGCIRVMRDQKEQRQQQLDNYTITTFPIGSKMTIRKRETETETETETERVRDSGRRKEGAL